MNVPIREYDQVLFEEHVEHSTSLHTFVKGRQTCHVGPLARYNLNYDKFPDLVKNLAKEVGLGPKCRNPFKSIIVRALETVFAVDEAVQIIEKYEEPDSPSVPTMLLAFGTESRWNQLMAFWTAVAFANATAPFGPTTRTSQPTSGSATP